MKRRNGFTLIELLAVTVVLIAIILIAIPTVTRLTTETKQKAFEDSAYGIIKAGDLYYSRREMMGEELVETKFNFPNNMDGLEFSGTVPKSGSMIITAEGDIGLAISNGKYCITKDYDSSDIKVTKDTKNCNLPSKRGSLASLAVTSEELGVTSIDACATSGTCEPGTAFAIKVNDTTTYKFYVLNDDGNQVNLIMNRNLGDAVPWSSGDGSSGPLVALKALKERTEGWINVPSYSYTLNYGIVNDYDDLGFLINERQGVYSGEYVQNVRVRMLSYDEATSSEMGCVPYQNTCPEWLDENNDYGYWLSYATSSIDAFYLSERAIAPDFPDSVAYGLRPVITLSK